MIAILDRKICDAGPRYAPSVRRVECLAKDTFDALVHLVSEPRSFRGCGPGIRGPVRASGNRVIPTTARPVRRLQRTQSPIQERGGQPGLERWIIRWQLEQSITRSSSFVLVSPDACSRST